MATRYDRVIPPGGKGTITIEIDTQRIRGAFRKKAIIWSNDQERMSVALYLSGEVKPLISLEPGGYVSLRGIQGRVPSQSLAIVNHQPRPVKILRIEASKEISGRIQWLLKVTKAGYVYQLEIQDVSKRPGPYNGRLTLHTDNAEKPKLLIMVTGEIREP